MGLLIWTKARGWDYYDGRILGGSGEQAMYCYEHCNSFWGALDGALAKDLAQEPMRERTRLRNRSKYAIFTASEKRVRGAHPNDLAIDELDEVHPHHVSVGVYGPFSFHGMNHRSMRFKDVLESAPESSILRYTRYSLTSKGTIERRKGIRGTQLREDISREDTQTDEFAVADAAIRNGLFELTKGTELRIYES